jgi:phage terminase small subunit
MGSAPRPRPNPLTAKQYTFVQEYAATLNGTQSAIAAGYAPASATGQAVALLRHPTVYRLLARKAQARASKLELKADQILERWRRLASCSVADCYDPVTGNPKRVSELHPDVAYALDGIETNAEGYIIKARMSGRVEALRFLSKYHELAADAMPLPAPPSTVVNHTEVYLGSLTTDELKVIERVLVREQGQLPPGPTTIDAEPQAAPAVVRGL